VRDDVFIAIYGNLNHREAFAQFYNIAPGNQVAFARFAQKVDIQTGGDGEFYFTQHTEYNCKHAQVSEHHHEGPCYGAARAQGVFTIGQNQLGFTCLYITQINACLGQEQDLTI
jgi:hypothetical protein